MAGTTVTRTRDLCRDREWIGLDNSGYGELIMHNVLDETHG